MANTRIHAETKQKPIERFLASGPVDRPVPELVAEAFRWSAVRRVTKTATVSLFANRYSVDPSLVGQNVELRFDPEDLGSVGVYADGVDVGTAAPFAIGRHVHPAVPQAEPSKQAESTGIDYLRLVVTAEEEAQGSARIDYRELHLPGFGDGDSDDEEVTQ